VSECICENLPIILKYDIIGQLLEIEFTYKTMQFEWNNEKQRVSLSPLRPFTTNKHKTTEELINENPEEYNKHFKIPVTANDGSGFVVLQASTPMDEETGKHVVYT